MSQIESMSEAVNVAVIELLVAPEYGMSFIREIALCQLGVADGKTLVAMNSDVMDKLAKLAESVIAELKEERNIELYKNLQR